MSIASATAVPVAATPMSAPGPAAATTATLPMDAGATGPLGGKSGGGFRLKFDVKKMLLFGAGGAVLGMMLPVIPGGPLGGAAIGAALSLLI